MKRELVQARGKQHPSSDIDILHERTFIGFIDGVDFYGVLFARDQEYPEPGKILPNCQLPRTSPPMELSIHVKTTIFDHEMQGKQTHKEKTTKGK